MNHIYLDYAAASPIHPDVLKVMLPFFSEKFYNPSAIYSEARNVKEAMNSARAQIGQVIGARPSEIIFTSGGTESANLAITGVAESFPGSEIIVSSIEHEAVLKPAKKYNTKLIPVDEKGLVKLDSLRELISDKTVLISVMYANNEVGTVQPIKDISEIVKLVRVARLKKGIKTPLYLHTDAAQAPQYLDLNVARLGVDLMTLNGGKIYGPKQSGILFVKAGVKLRPIILGGGQEFGYRSGTENTASCIGFAKALDLATQNRTDTSKKVSELAKYFMRELENNFEVTINGHKKIRIPNNVHVTFKGADNERVLFYLDQNGIFASAGSACSASSDEPSHVLKAMGISDKDARSSIRFSLSKDTTKDEIDLVLKKLVSALKA